MSDLSVEARAVLDAVKDFSETCHASPPGSRFWVESAWRLDDAWTTYTKSLERGTEPFVPTVDQPLGRSSKGVVGRDELRDLMRQMDGLCRKVLGPYYPEDIQAGRSSKAGVPHNGPFDMMEINTPLMKARDALVEAVGRWRTGGVHYCPELADAWDTYARSLERGAIPKGLATDAEREAGEFDSRREPTIIEAIESLHRDYRQHLEAYVSKFVSEHPGVRASDCILIQRPSMNSSCDTEWEIKLKESSTDTQTVWWQCANKECGGAKVPSDGHVPDIACCVCECHQWKVFELENERTGRRTVVQYEPMAQEAEKPGVTGHAIPPEVEAARCRDARGAKIPPQISTPHARVLKKKTAPPTGGDMPAYRERCKPWKKDEAKRMRANPTPAEAVLWAHIKSKKLGFKFRRQSVILGYIADFYCPSCKLIIEADGAYHNKQEEYDRRRDEALSRYGFTVVRFRNADIITNPHDVIRAIKELLVPKPGPLEKYAKINSKLTS